MGASFSYTSYTDKIMRDIRKVEKTRIREAGIHVRRKMRDKARQKRVSSPGDPPGRRSGKFFKSIRMSTKQSESFVGSTSPLVHLLEQGTKERHTKSGKYAGSMSARPIVLPTFIEELDEIQTILGTRWL